MATTKDERQLPIPFPLNRQKRRIFDKREGMCSHAGAAGPCLPRLADGRCIWCERPMSKAARRTADVCDGCGATRAQIEEHGHSRVDSLGRPPADDAPGTQLCHQACLCGQEHFSMYEHHRDTRGPDVAATMCTGCTMLREACQPLWASWRKCCPDCSHGGDA